MDEIYDLIDRLCDAVDEQRASSSVTPNARGLLVGLSRVWHTDRRCDHSTEHWQKYIERTAEAAVSIHECERAPLVADALHSAVEALRSEVRTTHELEALSASRCE